MMRRGVAMILVLGASVLLLAAAAVIARARVTSTLRSDTDERLALAWSVVDAAESPIREWLARESGSVVLAPNTDAAMVLIMDSEFAVSGVPVTVSVTAWDQCGMLPALGSAVRLAGQRPGPTGEDIGWFGHAHPGLDLWEGAGSAFPSRLHPDRIGGLVATHNPRQTGRSRGGRVTLNLNTAPAWLIDPILAGIGREGLDAILAARRQGEFVSFRGANHDWQGTELVLTGSSNAWGVRTDVTAGGVVASVWSVYSRRGGTWVREQRLVIAD